MLLNVCLTEKEYAQALLSFDVCNSKCAFNHLAADRIIYISIYSHKFSFFKINIQAEKSEDVVHKHTFFRSNQRLHT